VRPLISPSAIRLTAARPELMNEGLGSRGSNEKVAIRALAASLVARLPGRPPRTSVDWPGAVRTHGQPVAGQRSLHT
jgi:hypothetical protein